MSRGVNDLGDSPNFAGQGQWSARRYQPERSAAHLSPRWERLVMRPEVCRSFQEEIRDRHGFTICYGGEHILPPLILRRRTNPLTVRAAQMPVAVERHELRA